MEHSPPLTQGSKRDSEPLWYPASQHFMCAGGGGREGRRGRGGEKRKWRVRVGEGEVASFLEHSCILLSNVDGIQPTLTGQMHHPTLHLDRWQRETEGNTTQLVPLKDLIYN